MIEGLDAGGGPQRAGRRQRDLRIENDRARADPRVVAETLDPRVLVGDAREGRELAGGQGGRDRDLRHVRLGPAVREQLQRHDLRRVDRAAAAEGHEGVGVHLPGLPDRGGHGPARDVLANAGVRPGPARAQQAFEALHESGARRQAVARQDERPPPAEAVELARDPVQRPGSEDHLLELREPVFANHAAKAISPRPALRDCAATGAGVTCIRNRIFRQHQEVRR